MAAFQINTKTIKKHQGDIISSAGELNSLAGEINAVKSALSFRGEYRAGIVNNLGRIAEQCAESSRNMRTMGDALGQTIEKYEQTENKILEHMSGSLNLKNSTSGTSALPTGVPASGSDTKPAYSYIGSYEYTGDHAAVFASASADWYKDGEFNPYLQAEASAGAALWKEEWDLKDNGEASAELLYASASASSDFHMTEDGSFKPGGKAEAGVEIGVAKGEIKKEGQYGSASMTGAIASADAHAEIELKTINGLPAINAEAAAAAAVLSGAIDGTFGTDNYNIHTSASGAVLGAEAEAKFNISGTGFSAEAGAEAYLAHGEVKTGFTVLGIQVDFGLEGSVGVGGKAEAEITTNSVEFDISAALGLGAGASISVDWSQFELPSLDDVNNFFDSWF